jgi:hypothetical protein
MRLTEEEMRFLGNKKEKLEEYWAGHLSPTPFLLSIREEDSQSAQG